MDLRITIFDDRVKNPDSVHGTSERVRDMGY